MHDGIELERRGLATAVIVTEPFVATAKAMARLDGWPDYGFAVIPHPVADLDDAGVAAVARIAVDQVLALISG